MQGAIILNYLELHKIPVYEYRGAMKERFIAIKVITNYQFDNENLLVSNIYGDWYSMSVTKSHAKHGSIEYKRLIKLFGENINLNKVYKIFLWDYRGTTGIYHNDFIVINYDDPIPENIIKEIENETGRYSKGYIKCSDCKKEIKQNDIGGRYFAGSYCIDCWVGKTGKYKDKYGWKKVEADETYE